MRLQEQSPASLFVRRLLHPVRNPTEKQTLVLAYAPALGYSVHMTPVYEALHRAGHTVVVATHGANLELLRHSPHVSHLFSTPDPQRHFLSAFRSLRAQLGERKLSPGWVLTGPQDQRSRISLLGALACAGRLGGYAARSAHYQRPLAYDRSLSRVANNLRLAKLLEVPIESCEPRVFFSPAQAETARQLLPEGSVLAVVAGNSGGLPTAWHDDRWAAVVRHAHHELGYQIVYLGATRDQAVVDRIRALAGGVGTSLAGRTGIGELAAVLAQSDLAVAIMTGTLHIARAVATPTVALGLAWEPPLEWMSPPQPHVHLLRGADAPRIPDYRLDDLTAAQVTAALTLMSRLNPPSPEARAARVAKALSLTGHQLSES